MARRARDDVDRHRATRRRSPSPAAATIQRPRTVDAAVDRYRDLLETAPASDRDQLIKALDTDVAGPVSATGDDLDEDLFGAPPSALDTTAVALEHLSLTFARRSEVVAASITREAAADLLHVTGQTVLDWLTNGDLVGLREGRRWALPVWQFDADTQRGFAGGIGAVAAVFPGGVVSLSRWMTTPSVDLDDRRPRDVLAEGDVDRVVDVAKSLTAAGW